MKLEEHVLGHLVTSENIQRVYDLGLSAKHFDGLIGTNRAVFQFIIKYWTDSGRTTPPTPEVLHHQFPAYVHVESEETLDWLVDELKKRFKSNGIESAFEKVAKLRDDGDVDSALREMAAAAFSIVQETSDRQSSANFTANAEDRRARYAERATFDGEIKGAPMGLEEVDKHTFGTMGGELTVVAGFAGTGKTWFLINAALAALRAGFSPYLVSLELSRQDVEDRMDALAASVSHEKLSRGKLSKDEIDQMEAVQQELSALSANLFVDQPNRNERTVQQLVNKARHSGSNFLLIDQLSFIQGTKDRYNSPREKYIEVTNDLKDAISETSDQKLPLLLAVQFNREQKKSGKSELYHMAESASIEQVADMAFGLNQSPEMRNNKAMEFTQLKFRRGALRSWMLNWDLGEKVRISVDQEIDNGV